MSKTPKRIVAKYVDGNGDYANVCDEEKDDVKRLLEQRVISEVVVERIEKVDREARSRERQRASIRQFDEFRSVLFQCVVLALLVGLLGSHFYGLIEALLYEPSSDFNVTAGVIGTAIVFVICAAVLAKSYVGRLFSATKQFLEARKQLNNE